MNTGLQTTLCPSCSRNVPRNLEVCVFCGVPTSTSTFAEVAETPEVPYWQSVHLSDLQQYRMSVMLDKIERDTRCELTATRGN